MKSIEVIVPRNIIKRFYPHPEAYGDFIVELHNGMITDVYYREEGYFITITNEEDLIDYLKEQPLLPLDHYYRNGIFSLRKIDEEDEQLLTDWSSMSGTVTSRRVPLVKVNSRKLRDIPKKMIAAVYWIEVGIIRISQEASEFTITLYLHQNLTKDRIGESHFVSQLDIDTLLFLIEEQLTV